MTPEEIKTSSQKKVQAITTLCEQLQVVPSAVQMINPEGIIQMAVYYTDTEKYDIDEPVTDKPNEEPKPEKTDGKPVEENKTPTSQ